MAFTKPGHPSARALAILRGRGIRHSATGRWFNIRRLRARIGNIPPAEAEERYYAMLNEARMAE